MPPSLEFVAAMLEMSDSRIRPIVFQVARKGERLPEKYWFGFQVAFPLRKKAARSGSFSVFCAGLAAALLAVAASRSGGLAAHLAVFQHG